MKKTIGYEILPYYVVTTKTLQIDLAAVSSSSEVAPRDSSLRSRMTTRGDIAKDLGRDKVLDVTSYYGVWMLSVWRL